MFLSSAKPQTDNDNDHIVALHLPLEVFWKLQDMLRETQFLTASGAISAAILDSYREVFRVAAPYAILEKDRIWLYDQKKHKDTG